MFHDIVKKYLENSKTFKVSNIGFNNRKYISYFHGRELCFKNNNKWYLKKFTNNIEKTKKKINGYLNKFTDKNYIEITEKIIKLKIDSIDLLVYLADNFFEKAINENYYFNYWIYLFKKIIFNNKKWKFNDKSFLTIIYDKLQSFFENIIKKDYSKNKQPQRGLVIFRCIIINFF